MRLFRRFERRWVWGSSSLTWYLKREVNKSVGGTPTEAGETPALPTHKSDGE